MLSVFGPLSPERAKGEATMNITDKMRLDWLIEKSGQVKFYNGHWWVEHQESQGVGAEKVDYLGLIYCDRPRQAIDAAIRSKSSARTGK